MQAVAGSYPMVDQQAESNKRSAVLAIRAECLKGVLQLPDITPSEYCTAMLFQALRFLSFESITIPKRLFAAMIIEKLVKRLGLE